MQLNRKRGKSKLFSDGTYKSEIWYKDNIAVEANNGGDTLTVKSNKTLKGLDSVQTKTVEFRRPYKTWLWYNYYFL